MKYTNRNEKRQSFKDVSKIIIEKLTPEEYELIKDAIKDDPELLDTMLTTSIKQKMQAKTCIDEFVSGLLKDFYKQNKE